MNTAHSTTAEMSKVINALRAQVADERALIEDALAVINVRALRDIVLQYMDDKTIVLRTMMARCSISYASSSGGTHTSSFNHNCYIGIYRDVYRLSSDNGGGVYSSKYEDMSMTLSHIVLGDSFDPDLQRMRSLLINLYCSTSRDEWRACDLTYLFDEMRD